MAALRAVFGVPFHGNPVRYRVTIENAYLATQIVAFWFYIFTAD
jgi:hypothetical protein